MTSCCWNGRNRDLAVLHPIGVVGSRSLQYTAALLQELSEEIRRDIDELNEHAWRLHDGNNHPIGSLVAGMYNVSPTPLDLPDTRCAIQIADIICHVEMCSHGYRDDPRKHCGRVIRLRCGTTGTTESARARCRRLRRASRCRF